MAYYLISDKNNFDVIREELYSLKSIKMDDRRVGVVIASTILDRLGGYTNNCVYNNDWVNAKLLPVEDFPLYISQLQYTSQEFIDILKGLWSPDTP